MVESRGRAGFVLETLPAIRIRGDRFPQNLDGDVPAELGMSGSIHLSHASGSERREDLVRAETSGRKAHEIWADCMLT